MKKAPKTITSEMMKSSIPSRDGSTREERFAGGGPWCSCATAGGLHQASTGEVEDSTCSTGLFVALWTRSTSLSAIHFELPSGSVEITIS